MQTIGILLPRSTFYPSASFDMYEGLRSGLKNLGREDIRIISENIGFGADKQAAYQSAERLLLHENVPVVFAYIGHRTAQLLRPLFMAANRLLVVLDAGAHMPQEWPPSPNIFYHSLHNALGAWLAARMASRDGYTDAGTASCFYDGGYLHTFALAQGFNNEGGKIVFNHATGSQPEDFTTAPLQQHLAAYPEACVLSLFSTEFAQWFYRDLAKDFTGKKVPVYTAPFALEESMLRNSAYPGNDIRGVAAWSEKLENPVNSAFMEQVTAAGRQANLFSLLGWEAASIGAEALKLMQENNMNAKEAGEKLKSFRFESPRGEISFHAATHYSLAPLFEATIKDDGKGLCSLDIQQEIADSRDVFEQLAAVPLENAVSGWYNSYTCI